MAQASMQPASSAGKSERPPILRGNGLKKTYRMGDVDVLVLKHVDITLRQGEFVAIEGRSGSGKSTLLHILGGLDSPDLGTLEFEGIDYTPRAPTINNRGRSLRWPVTATATESILVGAAIFAVLAALEWLTVAMLHVIVFNPLLQGAVIFFVTVAMASVYFGAKTYIREQPICGLRNTKFGFVFQFYHLLPELNVVENTLLSAMIEKSWWKYFAKRRDLVSRAKSLLQDLGLGHRLTHNPNQLSGGERQRVAIARALMNEPKILFADEPTGNLDYETGRQIMGVLEKLHQEKGQTIVMVTHDRSLASQADRVLVLRNGKLEKPGEPGPADKEGVLDYH